MEQIRRSPRALVVDDDPSMAPLMTRCLSRWGWEVDESRSVSAALGLFKKASYDLAVCDIDLPDGNGIFLATALAKVKPSLRVVMVSGSRDNISRAREAGFDRCLGKPFILEELKALVQSERPCGYRGKREFHFPRVESRRG